MSQELFEPALFMARRAEELYAAGKFEQVDGVILIADSWLQYLLHGSTDPDADAARENSLANPETRPLFSQSVLFTEKGWKAADSDPRRAVAALQIAALYQKLAETWEPAADDEATQKQLEDLRQLIESTAARAQSQLAKIPAPSVE